MIRLLTRLGLHVPLICAVVLGWLTHVVASPSNRRRSLRASMGWMMASLCFFYAFWPADTSVSHDHSAIELNGPIPTPALAEAVPPYPQPPPSPPTCTYSCLSRAWLQPSAGNAARCESTEPSVSLLHSIAIAFGAGVRSLPLTVALRARACIEVLGPPGSFARDTWPILFLASIVTILALLSVASPIVRPLVAIVVAPMADCIRRHRTALWHGAARASAGLLILLALGLADHSRALFLTGRYALVRATVPFASPIALCCSFARALALTPSGGQSRLITSHKQIGVENALLVTITIAFALFGTAHQIRMQAAEESGLMASTEQPALPRVERIWAKMVHIVMRQPLTLMHRAALLVVPEPACSLRLCASVLEAVAGLAAWSAVAVGGVATGSEALKAVARAPLRGARAGIRMGLRATIACARLVRAWRNTTCGLLGLSLVMASLVLGQHPLGFGPIHAPRQLALLLGRVLGTLTWARYPLTRASLAIWRDASSGHVARSWSHLLFVLPTSAGSVELLCIDWKISFRPLRSPLKAVQQFLAKPPPPPVKFMRDGVAPFVLASRLLAQHASRSQFASLDAVDTCPLEHGYGWLFGSDACAVISVLEIIVSVGLMAAGYFVMWKFLREQPVVVSALARAHRWRLAATALLSALRLRATHAARRMGADVRAACVSWGKKCAAALVVAYRSLRAAFLALYFLCAIALRHVRAAVSLVWQRAIEPTLNRLMWASIRLLVFVRNQAMALAAAARKVIGHCWNLASKVMGLCWDLACRIGRRMAQFCVQQMEACWRHVVAPSMLWLHQCIIVPTANLVRKVAMVLANRLTAALRTAAMWVSAALYRHFPLIACASSCMSCYLFAFRACAAVHFALWSTCSASQPLAAGLASCSGSGAAAALVAAVLGAAASGAVTILLAGEVAGSTSLQSLGIFCLRHCDLGAIAAARWMLLLTRRLSRGIAEGILLLASSLSRACRHLARRIAALAASVCAAIWAATRKWLLRLLGHVYRLLASVLSIAVVLPCRTIWRSPTAALLASASLVYAVFCLHRTGAWGGLLGAASKLASASLADVETVRYAPHGFTHSGAFGALISATSRVSTAVHTGSSMAATASRRALSIGSAAADALSLDEAFSSTTALHASTSFSFLVWATLVAVVQLGHNGRVPPKAIAAAQLVLAIVSQVLVAHKMGMTTNPTVPLLIVLLLAAVYLRLAASAAAERRQAIRELDQSFREAQRLGRESMRTGENMVDGKRFVAAILSTAPKPERVFSTETCVICLEPLGDNSQVLEAPDGQVDADAPATLPCGHQFHTECVCRWLQTMTGGRTSPRVHGRCPTCREPIATSRRMVERALFADA